MKSFFAVLLLFGFVGRAMAADEIVIYKGTETHRESFSANIKQPAMAGVYCIVDYTSNKVARFIFYTKGQKKFFSKLTEYTLKQNSAQLADGTATLLAGSLSINSDADNYAVGIIYLRGKNEVVVLRKLPSQVSTLRPRSIVFMTRLTGKGTGVGAFAEDNLNATIVAGVTISTNNGGNTTFDEAKTAILQKLGNQGYTEE